MTKGSRLQKCTEANVVKICKNCIVNVHHASVPANLAELHGVDLFYVDYIVCRLFESCLKIRSLKKAGTGCPGHTHGFCCRSKTELPPLSPPPATTTAKVFVPMGLM